VQKVGRLLRRKLGYSKRDASVLIGAGDMEPMLVEAAFRCGINYFHYLQKEMYVLIAGIALKHARWSFRSPINWQKLMFY